MEQQKTEQLNRWRLMLGKYADQAVSFSGGAKVNYMSMDDVLDFLYSREYGEEQGIRDMDSGREGGHGASSLTVPEWINEVRRLFPKETVEIMEKQALDRYGMTELLTDPEVLKQMEPNQELLKMILQMKGKMSPAVLQEARRIVAKIVDELMKKLENDVRLSLTGVVDKNLESPVHCARNLDIKRTIKNNLKHYDMENQRLVLEKVYFYSRLEQYQQWHIVIAVDESGSMLNSVIHSAIMAGIFAKLPMIDTKLVIFDTEVVDLSGYVDDPVETLMSVQLGGGTNIAKAVAYCDTLVTEPERTIFVLVSDLYEGGGYANMYSAIKTMLEAGTKVMVITALDQDANPNYNRDAAGRVAALGGNVGAMTPKQLSEWVGGVIRG